MATKLKLPSLSLLKPRDAFAIDFGTSSVKILFLKANGNRYSLVKWSVIPVGEGVPSVSVPRDAAG
jgi:Tfp pilus assembly PilM family ATPase